MSLIAFFIFEFASLSWVWRLCWMHTMGFLSPTSPTQSWKCANFMARVSMWQQKCCQKIASDIICTADECWGKNALSGATMLLLMMVWPVHFRSLILCLKCFDQAWLKQPFHFNSGINNILVMLDAYQYRFVPKVWMLILPGDMPVKKGFKVKIKQRGARLAHRRGVVSAYLRGQLGLFFGTVFWGISTGTEIY